MKDAKELTKKIQELVELNTKLANGCLDTLRGVVNDFGGKVEINRQTDGVSLYIQTPKGDPDYENVAEVDEVFINEEGEIIISTEYGNEEADYIDCRDLINVLEWIKDQIQYPEWYEDDDDYEDE